MTTLPTQDQVDASAEPHIERLRRRDPEIGRLLHTATKVPDLPRSHEWKAVRLETLRDKLAKLVAAESCCRSGCSHCCNMATAISTREAQKISTFIKQPYVDLPFTIPNREWQVEKYMGVPCPFLKGNLCSIYEVRPSSCRTNFNLSEYPEICEITDAPSMAIPNLDMRSLCFSEAVAAFDRGDTLADIREFFPEVTLP